MFVGTQSAVSLMVQVTVSTDRMVQVGMSGIKVANYFAPKKSNSSLASSYLLCLGAK
jgi:hypothetical protein